MEKVKTDLSNLNDQQREAVVSETKRLLVLAGAGSGKTKTLLQKLIYLIEERNVNPSNILAITFTKNAANEMLDRLIISRRMIPKTIVKFYQIKINLQKKRILSDIFSVKSTNGLKISHFVHFTVCAIIF